MRRADYSRPDGLLSIEPFGESGPCKSQRRWVGWRVNPRLEAAPPSLPTRTTIQIPFPAHTLAASGLRSGSRLEPTPSPAPGTTQPAEQVSWRHAPRGACIRRMPGASAYVNGSVPAQAPRPRSRRPSRRAVTRQAPGREQLLHSAVGESGSYRLVLFQRIYWI
jgi:hypothetical protein